MEILMTSLSELEIRQIFRSELSDLLQELHNEHSEDLDERLTRKDISLLYKISFGTIHKCMKKGLIYEKCGRKTLFRREDVDNFFKKTRR